MHLYVCENIHRYKDCHILSYEALTESEENDVEMSKPGSRMKCDMSVKCDGYFVSVFFRELTVSASYRRCVLLNFLNKCNSNSEDLIIVLLLERPYRDVMDMEWNNKIDKMVMEKLELDHAMSWLSTLGGAFSALGDSFEHCAKVAGNISIQQFKIALRLGEPPLAARCKLFMALSLIQQGYLKFAKKMIIQQFDIGKQWKDVRLQNMCKGVWSKLQYVRKIKSG